VDRVVDKLHRLEESPCGKRLKFRDWRSCFLFVYNGERARARVRERKEALARARSTDRERKTEVEGASNTVDVDTMQPKLVAIFWSCSGGELFGEGRRPCGPHP
jgi:hypothetical protein